MPVKGKLVAPKISLARAHKCVMAYIARSRAPVGVFFVGGKIVYVRRTAPTFDKRVARLGSQLVGVYDLGADSQAVLEDLKTFYPDEAAV